MIEIAAAIATLSAEQQREWSAAHEGHDGDGCALISQWTPEQLPAVEVALHDYALASDDARVVLLEIAQWSRRLGVVLTCRVAREALRYVPEGEHRPRLAIETAERWVRGEASAEECEAAWDAARDYAHSIQVANNYTRSEATCAATAAANAADCTDDSVDYSYSASASAAALAVARVRAVQCAASYAAQCAELRRLCGVIATEIAPALDVLRERQA